MFKNLRFILILLLLLPVPARAQEVQQAAPVETVAANTDDEVVYIDPEGYIRVYDPVGSPQITWVSPEGGWNAAAVGDFTGEGDDEIVAVGGEGAASRLVVYDPVIAAGAVDASQQFNGVPWRTLYSTYLGATPRLVAVGEFNTAVPGREIVYTTDDPSSDGDPRSRITILAQTAGPATGGSWAPYSTSSSGQQWSDISTGDLEVSGLDNIAFIDEDRGVLAVYRLAGSALQRYYVNASDTREWSSSAIGNVDPATAQPELVLVRRADRPLASLVVLRYQAPDSFADVYLRDFNPAPRVVFLADVTGWNESEMFMLRNVTRTAGCPSPYNTAPFQLIMRSRGDDRPPPFEVCLDQANTFRYGAGGDLYGDGLEEAIVLSATQLRIFPNLHTTFIPASVVNVSINSNARTIVTGNLDRAGHVLPNTLASSQARLSFSANAGSQSGTATVQLTNSASSDPIPLHVRTSPQVDFVRWTLSSSATPADLTVYIDAADLLPGITYGADLLIDGVGVSVSNTPLRIPVLVKVDTGLVLRPTARTLVVRTCAAQTEPLQISLRVLGSPGMSFSASVAPGPVATDASLPGQVVQPEAPAALEWPVNAVPWISSATSPTSTIPSTITLALTADALGAFNQAHVSVDGVLGSETFPRFANITVVCTDNPVYLPLVAHDDWPE